MSTAVRWIIAILVVAALGWLLWWSGWLSGKGNPSMGGNTQATSTSQTETPQNGMSASNDASDGALTQDSAAIDAQIGAYATDRSDLDSSINDKQISQ